MALELFTNTYVVDATPYLGGDPVWEAASASEREVALVTATRVLDQNPWLGAASSVTQPLAWPRESVSYWDPVLNLVVNWSYTAPAEGEPDPGYPPPPARLAKATAYLAKHYLQYPTALEQYAATFDRIKIGPIEVENTDAAVRTTEVPLIPANVTQLLEPLFDSSRYSTSRNWWRAN